MIQYQRMWYYSENSQQMGPISEEELKLKTRSGLLFPATLIWKEGMVDWKPIAQVPEIALALSVPVSISAPGVAPIPAPAANPYQSPALQQQMGSSTGAIGSHGTPFSTRGVLVFSILVTAVSVLTCQVISLILGIVAIVFTSKAGNRLAQGDIFAAKSAAKTAKILCWVGAAIWTIMILVYVVFSLNSPTPKPTF